MSTSTPGHTAQTLVEQIAKLCHENNKHYCRSIGDFSQHSWEESPEWQRQSAINGVRFHLANPQANASASHESWLREKQATGWSYGPVKDADLKQHPCFVPYNELPLEQRLKDYLFRAIVHAYLDAGAELGQ